MASVQKITGKRGTSYRAQFMRNGRRVGKTFPTKKEAERFLAHLTVSDDLSACLTDVNLTTITLAEAIRQYLDQHTGKDTNIIQRLGWWSDRIGDKPVGKVTRQQVKAGLSALRPPPPSIVTARPSQACSRGSVTSTTSNITPPGR